MCGSEKNSGFWRRLKQKALDTMPNATFKDSEKALNRWKNFDERMSRPAENRLLMGATALLTQPAIDYYNHKVDKETREVSKNRTLAKIIAGTTVGILVRGTSYEIVKRMTDLNGKEKFSKSLLPTKFLEELATEPKLLKNYRSALSTSLAILAMCITNFAIDAPLTVFLTNHFNSKNKKAKEGSIANE